MGMFVFLVCMIMLLIGSMHVKYLYEKDSPQLSFSLENVYHLECYHLIFDFVKTKHVCLPMHPLSSSPWFIFSLYLSSCYMKYIAI